MLRYSGSKLHTVCFILMFWFEVCRSSGYVELRVISVEKRNGSLASDTCCSGGVLADQVQDEACGAVQCSTYIKVCLKEYQVGVISTGLCTFGTGRLDVVRLDGFDPDSNKENHVGTIIIPFQFGWPNAYTLILEAWVWDNRTTSNDSDLLIERSVHRAKINPGEWQVIQHTGINADIQYSVFVHCDHHYYGSKCNKQCRPRDDYFGHYDCDHNGNLQCLEGWTEPDCTKAICKQGCSELHGSCAFPGLCTCRDGWQGSLCDECLPHPHCVHGTCVTPGQCVCERNWGGLFCNKDMNYCGSHQPCVNGGTCVNTEPDKYQCVCPDGYSGKNCEIAEHACMSSPCANGGNCYEVASGFECRCLSGWMGPTCAIGY